MTETRITNPDTGGQKGSKPCQLFWIDPAALEALGRVAGMGTEKYSPHNYRQGVAPSLHFNAAYRHILLAQNGEDIDPESGEYHLAHAAWNLLAALTSIVSHPELDDRYVEPTNDPTARFPKCERYESVWPNQVPVIEDDGRMPSKLESATVIGRIPPRREDLWEYEDVHGDDYLGPPLVDPTFIETQKLLTSGRGYRPTITVKDSDDGSSTRATDDASDAWHGRPA